MLPSGMLFRQVEARLAVPLLLNTKVVGVRTKQALSTDAAFILLLINDKRLTAEFKNTRRNNVLAIRTWC